MRRENESFRDWDAEKILSFVRDSGFKSKSEWHKASPGSQKRAKLMGVLDRIYEECGIPKHKHKTVDLHAIVDRVKALNVASKAELQTRAPSLYAEILRNKLMGEVQARCGIRNKHVYGESLYDVVSSVRSAGFTRLIDWIKTNNRTYATAVRKGWVDAVVLECGLVRLNRRWESKEQVLEYVMGAGFKSRGEWCEADFASYDSCVLRGWVDWVVLNSGMITGSALGTNINDGRKTYVYVCLLLLNDGTTRVGYGCTYNIKARFRRHKINAKGAGSVIFVKAFEFPTWEESKSAEKAVLVQFPQVDSGIDGFRTESTHVTHLPEILDMLEGLRFDAFRNGVSADKIMSKALRKLAAQGETNGN